MHEWALAEAIVKYIENEAENRGVKVYSNIDIILGELQQIDEEILRYALTELLKVLREAKGIDVKSFRFLREEAVFRCSVCGYEWRLKDIGLNEEFKESIHFIPEIIYSLYRCPSCGSSDFEIVRGRGIELRLEGE